LVVYSIYEIISLDSQVVRNQKPETRNQKPFTMAIQKTIKPTESELEILQILWQRGLATVREVHEELLKTKDAGYTTTLKLMQIMHEKGLVKRDESMRTHVYQPAVNKEKTQKHLLGKMIDNLFGGSSTQLVLQALGEQKASREELEQIQILLDNLKK
jgi:BlaI family transcriptional regulator, penicillinase repressor